MPTAITHDPSFTTPVSSTNTALVRWSGTGGDTVLDTSGILSNGSSITLNARGEVRFADADSSHYIALESPATVSTSYTMTLPAAVPSANDYLKVTSYSGGAGVLEWATAGGALTLVDTTTISNDSDVTIDGLTNTYDAFLIVGSEITLATHAAQLQLRCGDSNGIDSASTDYSYSVEYLQAGSTSHTAYSHSGTTFILVLNYMSSQSQSWHGGGFHCWLYRNGGSGGSTMATFTGQGVSYYGANMIGGTFIGARNTTIDIDRIQIRANSGNVATGRLTVWGLKHT